MGNSTQKDTRLSSSTQSLNTDPSSRQKRSASTCSGGSQIPSTDSSRTACKKTGRESLRRNIFRAPSSKRASSPIVMYDQKIDQPPKDRQFSTPHQREMIRRNWDSYKRHELCRRIYLRAFMRRPDIREIFNSTHTNADDIWRQEVYDFAEFMQSIIENLDDPMEVRILASDFGRQHGPWRQYGFKSEFWVTLAEAMTKECVYLDGAVHPPAEVLDAWSKLVASIFGCIRDGYYESLRSQRRLSRLPQSSSQTSLNKLQTQHQRQRTYSLEGTETIRISKIQSPKSPLIRARRGTHIF